MQLTANLHFTDKEWRINYLPKVTVTKWQNWDVKITHLTERYISKKVFLYLPINTFVWSPAVAFMEIKDLWLCMAQHTFRYKTEQRSSLEYGHINLILYRKWQENKQLRRCAKHNQAASLLYTSSISTISHYKEVTGSKSEGFIPDTQLGQWKFLAGVLRECCDSSPMQTNPHDESSWLYHIELWQEPSLVSKLHFFQADDMCQVLIPGATPACQLRKGFHNAFVFFLKHLKSQGSSWHQLPPENGHLARSPSLSGFGGSWSLLK